ncbi:beta-galactosidase trimerization domain-containing protein [Cerasicoccus frondis]|uniref:beta-galactosidase trimerization domain-containing protein n=1 Tax=Cerasicoccus frondis TaxID=490090 RepID=UPI00285249AB|nr:beta-galactosidase trimerization domain-containing protein [Cerasicoccus frondis]
MPFISLHAEQWIEVFEPTELRGFGGVSGRAQGTDQDSILQIECESPEKAQLLQAKCLSDFSLISGVSEQVVRVYDRNLNALQVDSQGSIVVLQAASEVQILTAESLASLKLAIEKDFPNGLENWSSDSKVEVPMWLDRWDRFSFRFYYRPWELPKGESVETYDFFQEFEFAEKNDRAGFMLWEYMNSIDTAEGMTNSVYHDWARRAARDRRLPIGLNMMAGGRGIGYLKNEFREETQLKMPHFSGNYHKIGDPLGGGTGTTSWNSKRLIHKELSDLKHTVEGYVQDPNLTTILEPHGELRHGPHDIFMEYGSVADASYREYLIKEYSDVESLNARWGTNYSSMDDVRAPEVASFLGWGESALDLSGLWKIRYESLPEGVSYKLNDNNKTYSKDIPTLGASDEWFTVDFDDSEWGELEASATDHVMMIEQRPAVLRRTIDVPQAWLKHKDQVWLYLWDLNMATKGVVKAYLNGELITEEEVEHHFPHWTAIEVSDQLVAGQNQLSIRLPQAMIAYRIYLSSHPPKQYPDLEPEVNARWVDFMNWTQWSRVDVAKRSLNMIRQVTPDHQVMLMAPDGYAASMLELAKDYGANFHNTGYMGAFWADYLPSLMRGAGLPFSLEPGGPARDLDGFKKHLGLYLTEGLQGIDYFIHIGNILWDEDIRAHFEEHLPAIKLLGKHNAPKADVAALYSTNANTYTSFPWKRDAKRLNAGYWEWNWRAYMRGVVESDAVAETSFRGGDTEKYKVIIDTNTSVMDATLLEEIEAYVRQGGVFVTFVETGRHTPERPNSWPISSLTGFRVSELGVSDSGMYPAEGASVFHGDWKGVRAYGLSLEPVAPDAKPLMSWEDGSVAIGVRPLGEGYIVQMGCRFDKTKMPDRLEPADRPLPERIVHLRRLFSQLLEWQGVDLIESKWSPENQYVLLRHFVTNNGLYDVWTVWNQHKESTLSGRIELPESNISKWAYDVVRGQQMEVESGGIPIDLEPMQTRVFLTPRSEITKAPIRWFALQRNWWRAAVEPDMTEYAEPLHPHSVDLGKAWKILPSDGSEPEAEMLAIDYDDSAWGELEMLGAWSTIPEYTEVSHALLRKRFTVPADWTDGFVEMGLHSWWQSTFVTKGRIWLDGQLVQDWSHKGIVNANPFNALTPGSEHVLAVEIQSDSVLAGTRGTAWLWHQREPEASIDLAGAWESSLDSLFYDASIELPGKYDAMQLRREVFIPKEYSDKRVRVAVHDVGGIIGVLMNGRWVMRFRHQIEDRFELDVTPWIKFGEINMIELSTREGPVRGEIRSVGLKFYVPSEEDFYTITL